MERAGNFFAVLLKMSMFPVLHPRLYWSKNLGIQYVNTSMTRVLFEHITKYLYFNDDSKMVALGEETFDKVFKLRPPITHLPSKFRDILTFPWKEVYFALNSSNKPFTWLQNFFQTQRVYLWQHNPSLRVVKCFGSKQSPF